MKSLSLNKPHIIVMVGIPGSGKSFFAEKFAETFHAPYISRDKIATLVPDTEIADKITLLQLSEFLKTKQSVIIEGPTLTRSERSEIAKLARRGGYECMLVWVQTHPDTARMRSLKSAKGTIQSVRTPSDFDQQIQRFNAPTAQEKPVVISGMHTYATQARAILKRLSHQRTEEVTQTRPPTRETPPPQAPQRRNITIN